MTVNASIKDLSLKGVRLQIANEFIRLDEYFKIIKSFSSTKSSIRFGAVVRNKRRQRNKDIEFGCEIIMMAPEVKLELSLFIAKIALD